MKILYFIVSWGLLTPVALTNCFADFEREVDSQKQEVEAIPSTELELRVEKNKEDGRWYAVFESKKWRILGNSFSKRGQKGTSKMHFGEFVGMRDATGSVTRRVLDVKAGSTAELSLGGDDGTELLMWKFDGTTWIRK